jgi:uncharacterized phage protein gp47/JayE
MITIPTINQLYTGILADLEAEYEITIPVFGKNFLRALAAVQAAKLKIFYLMIGMIQKNIFADTADPESLGGTLERFGRVKLGRNPFAATSGQYTVQVTGTIGSLIPASSTFKSNDDSLNPGKLFILDVDFTLTSSPDTITLRALAAGTGSKLSVSDNLTATAPIAGVNKIAEVIAEFTAPVSAEDIEVYRNKIIESFRLEPQGGAATDYRLWAADAAGVKQTYPYASSGNANEVDVYVEATIEDSTDGKGTPSSTILDNVSDVIEFDPDTSLDISQRGRRPLGVYAVNALPVAPLDVVITITGFSGLTTAIQDLIEVALTDRISNIRPFVAAAEDLIDKDDIFDINTIIYTILTARPGSIFTGISMTIDGVAETSYTFTDGNIPFLNAVNYV